MLKRICFFLLMICSAGVVLAKDKEPMDETRLIPPGSTVYIEPAEGFEADLAAALARKKVPLTVVAHRGGADFIISATDESKKVTRTETGDKEQTVITLRNARSGVIVFDYPVNRQSFAQRKRGQAESCAAHLRNQMQKDRKSLEKMKKDREREKKNLEKARQDREEDRKDLEKARKDHEKAKKNPEKGKK